MVYKFFRWWEYWFGRTPGIKREASASVRNGVATYQFHSLEAILTHIEERVKGLVPKLELVRVWIPVLSTPTGLPMPLSPYLFAIAYDNSVGDSSAEDGSISYTVTGSDPMLLASGYVDNFSSYTNCALQYNSVEGTTVQGQNRPSGYYGQRQAIWAPPATGSNTFAWQNTEVGHAHDATLLSLVSYSGVDQTTTPDATSQTYVTSSASTGATQSITVVGSDCWALCTVAADAGNIAISSGGSLRIAGRSSDYMTFDTDGTISSGNHDFVLTWNSTNNNGRQAVSFAPSGGGGGGPRLLSLLGVGT